MSDAGIRSTALNQPLLKPRRVRPNCAEVWRKPNFLPLRRIQLRSISESSKPPASQLKPRNIWSNHRVHCRMGAWYRRPKDRIFARVRRIARAVQRCGSSKGTSGERQNHRAWLWTQYARGWMYGGGDRAEIRHGIREDRWSPQSVRLCRGRGSGRQSRWPVMACSTTSMDALPGIPRPWQRPDMSAQLP